MTLKKFLKHFNGWMGFVLGIILFLFSPKLYHMVDPVAGQFDAGYIHTIIFSFVVVSFASGFGWLLVRLTAPGLFSKMDTYLDGEAELCENSFIGIALYAFTMFLAVVVVCCLV